MPSRAWPSFHDRVSPGWGGAQGVQIRHPCAAGTCPSPKTQIASYPTNRGIGKWQQHKSALPAFWRGPAHASAQDPRRAAAAVPASSSANGWPPDRCPVVMQGARASAGLATKACAQAGLS